MKKGSAYMAQRYGVLKQERLGFDDLFMSTGEVWAIESLGYDVKNFQSRICRDIFLPRQPTTAMRNRLCSPRDVFTLKVARALRLGRRLELPLSLALLVRDHERTDGKGPAQIFLIHDGLAEDGKARFRYSTRLPEQFGSAFGLNRLAVRNQAMESCLSLWRSLREAAQ